MKTIHWVCIGRFMKQTNTNAERAAKINFSIYWKKIVRKYWNQNEFSWWIRGWRLSMDRVSNAHWAYHAQQSTPARESLPRTPWSLKEHSADALACQTKLFPWIQSRTFINLSSCLHYSFAFVGKVFFSNFFLCALPCSSWGSSS